MYIAHHCEAKIYKKLRNQNILCFFIYTKCITDIFKNKICPVRNPSIKTFVFIGALIALTTFYYACKKDLFTGERVDPKKAKEMLAYANGPKVEMIDYARFQSKANLNALGILKQEFTPSLSSKSKVMSIRTTDIAQDIKILTDSIKVIRDNGHTMYVFRVELSSKRAVTFQNLTIDESAEGTVAFLNTYTPTKKWISAWKNGQTGKFEGNIKVTYLSLGQGASGRSVVKTKNTGSVASMLICTTTLYYYEIAYSCASGEHFPGDPNCVLTGSQRAGYMYIPFEVTECVEDQNPGSGGTSPTPPGNYDPCPDAPGTPPSTQVKKSGQKIMIVIPPTDCDSVVVDCAGVPNGTAYMADCGCIGGTTGITECPPEIINNVTDTCLFKIAKLVLENNMVGEIAAIISALDSNTIVKVKIYDAPQNPDGSAGRTSETKWSPDPQNAQITNFSTNITLSRSLLLGSTKEHVATILIHEIVHAYFRESTSKKQEFDGKDHQDMATKYISPMANFISGLFGITLTDATALAWNTIADTDAFKNSTTFTIGSGSNAITITKQDLQDIATFYTLNPGGVGNGTCK